MRVVSMVPSWTETLLEAGVEVVGRTRFCIHPELQARQIPVVGGTKDWKWDAILNLKPDFLILDQEENPRFMAEQKEIPVLVTHVCSIQDVAGSLQHLSASLKNSHLLRFSEEWQQEISQKKLPLWNTQKKVPGLLEWGRQPIGEVKKIIYLIWQKPWIAVSANTFIGSMLAQCGLNIETYQEKYPKLDLRAETEKQSTLLLFSSEPYPFLSKREGLPELEFPYAFVNGESFSWFGVRSLQFLQGLRADLG